jgi:filamentous hemagglutinin family protein
MSFSFNYLALLLLLSGGFWSAIARGTLAQIIPDKSLGNEGSIVTPNTTVKDALADLISGGAVRGNNLFHSFSEFNIPDGGRVYFANPDGIANILTRVTGNNLSQIFGTLGVDGAAHLFLLNPNGIVFGENASLDVNGSFLATTANSYIFNNGFEYSASNPNSPPLLTINLPVGLQIGDNPGQIKVKGSGHSIIRQNDFAPYINLDRKTGLRVKPDRTLTLIGGEIDLEGGSLIAENGTIQLGSIAKGEVNLNKNSSTSWSIDYKKVEQFQDINLLQKALIDVSGANPGFVRLHGANIALKDGSVIVNNNSGFTPGGEIDLKAEKMLEITGADRNSLTRSGIVSNTLGFQKGASINLESNNLLITDNGSILASSYSVGSGGDIVIKAADSLVINGFTSAKSGFYSTSGIATFNFERGNAGNISLNTDRLELFTGGIVTSTVLYGTGSGGNIFVNVPESIVIEGIDFNTFVASAISSLTIGQGDAGDLSVNTTRLTLTDGGRIDSITLAQGNAGNLTLNALDSVEVTGTVPNSINPSLITSAASIVDPILQKTFNVPLQPSGNAGSLTIKTPQLKVTDGAQVTVRNDGLGDAGTLKIDVDEILLQAGGGITASTKSGNGGDIDLNVKNLSILRDRASISAEAKEAGNGGNINLNADAILLIDRSSIVANASEGMGGNINLTTQGLFVSPDSKISASSEFGLDGTVEVETINGDRSIELEQLPEKPIQATEQITSGCTKGNNQFALTGKGGLPQNPGQYLRSETVWQDLRLPLDRTTNFTTNDLPFERNSSQSNIVEAQAWKINQQGKVELVAVNSYLGFHSNPYQCL